MKPEYSFFSFLIIILEKRKKYTLKKNFEKFLYTVQFKKQKIMFVNLLKKKLFTGQLKYWCFKQFLALFNFLRFWHPFYKKGSCIILLFSKITSFYFLSIEETKIFQKKCFFDLGSGDLKRSNLKLKIWFKNFEYVMPFNQKTRFLASICSQTKTIV